VAPLEMNAGTCWEQEYNRPNGLSVEKSSKKRPFTFNLLTLWSRVLLEKLTGLQLVKKFPAFYGTRRFITAFTNARQLSLS